MRNTGPESTVPRAASGAAGGRLRPPGGDGGPEREEGQLPQGGTLRQFGTVSFTVCVPLAP